MQENLGKVIVLLYWEKSTWYSLGALAASCQKNQLTFKTIKNDPVKQIQEQLDKNFLVIYGESSRNMSLNGLKERLRKIRAQISSARLFIIVGGPHASGDPQSILDMGADIVVIGEGEVTFPELVFNIQKAQNKEKITNIPGIAYYNATGQFIKEQTRSPIVLDNYCPYLDNTSFPLHPPIELMRGCAFRCRFCQVGYMYGNPRFRSIDNVMKVVKHYYEFFNPLKKQVDIRFIAPNSLGYMEKKRGQANTDALFNLVKRLKKYDIRSFFGTFPSEVRPEYITPDILSLFDNLENKTVSVGFQSGSDRVLRYMHRGHTVSDGLNAQDYLTSYGLTPLFDFLLGAPSETLEEQWETLGLIRELGKSAQVRLHYFMPLPGTPWANYSPSPLDKNIIAEIGRLARVEIITGEFAKQIQFSNEND